MESPGTRRRSNCGNSRKGFDRHRRVRGQGYPRSRACKAIREASFPLRRFPRRDHGWNRVGLGVTPLYAPSRQPERTASVDGIASGSEWNALPEVF